MYDVVYNHCCFFYNIRFSIACMNNLKIMSKARTIIKTNNEVKIIVEIKKKKKKERSQAKSIYIN